MVFLLDQDKIMQNTEFKDRRIFERIPVKIPLRFFDPNSNKETLAQTLDISAQGIGLLADEKLSPNTSLEIWLRIPDKGQPLYTTGQVVWSEMTESNKYRAGIKLHRVDLMGISRVLRAM